MQIHRIQHMRTQEWTFNMVTVITTNILWHMAIRTGDRSDHTLVLHQEKQGFACHAMAFPEEAQHLAGLFGHSGLRPASQRINILWVQLGLHSCLHGAFYSAPRGAYAIFLAINFQPVAFLSRCLLLASVALSPSGLFVLESVFMTMFLKRESEDVHLNSLHFYRVKRKKN